MTLLRPPVRWFLSLAILVHAMIAWADHGTPASEAVSAGLRAHRLAPSADTLEAARDAAASARPDPDPQDSPPRFRAAAGEPAWYALEIPPGAGGQVLELAHPAVQSAHLYLLRAGDNTPLATGGRMLPPETRAGQRLPATLLLPQNLSGQTALVRVQGNVRLHGEFVLLPLDAWEHANRQQLGTMAACFVVAALGALYALSRAVRLRSTAYALYAALALSTGLAGMFVTGWGSAWLWPALSAWRGQMAAVTGCAASGLSLLLAERAFSLEVRAPRFSRLLRLLGVTVPLAALVCLVFPFPVQQAITLGISFVAILLSLVSFWLAWRTANRAATWLLTGFSPVIAGVVLTLLGLSGALAFTPWMLLAMPLGGALEVPFNLFGLHLLQRRRARVLASLAAIRAAASSGGMGIIGGPPADSMDSTGGAGTRGALLARLAPGAAGQRGGASLMLLRFDGLAPGAALLGQLDAERIEQFMHRMMAAAVRPSNQVGRWSYHEILLRNLHRQPDAEIDDLSQALFAQALRSERYGIAPRALRLRIAFARLARVSPPADTVARALSAALDDPAHAMLRRLEWDLEHQSPTRGAPLSRP